MNKEVISKKLKFEQSDQNLIVIAPEEYLDLLWACYPKGSGKIKYDLNRNTVWDAVALIGLRPVTQIAIDEKWSALRGRDHELVGK